MDEGSTDSKIDDLLRYVNALVQRQREEVTDSINLSVACASSTSPMSECTMLKADTSYIHLLPSTCFLYRQQNCFCFCCQFVACLLLDTKGYNTVIQVDRDRPKWIVISRRETVNMYPERATCCRAICVRTYNASGYKLLVRIDMLPGMCPGVNTACNMQHYLTELICRCKMQHKKG